MNLFLFPESAVLSNGYGIVVNDDYERLQPSGNDVIVWYTNINDNIKLRDSDIRLSRPEKLSFKRFKNMLFLKVGAEVNSSELSFLRNTNFENIFCGDVLFYRAIREMFPNNEIVVRFHNCFSRILNRKNLLDIKVDIKFYSDLLYMYQLEKEIFLDKKVHKIFISQEDKDYYTLMTKTNDADVWGIDVDIEKAMSKRKRVGIASKVIWFGGVEAHKKSSVKWFLNDIWPEIKRKLPDIEFHLWGNRTQKFDNPSLNIYGHGFYSGNDLLQEGKGLFINPDIIGGGVKIKVKSLIEEGVPFISTPFGYEGYDKEFIDQEYCIVAEPEKWAKTIIDRFLIQNIEC